MLASQACLRRLGIYGYLLGGLGYALLGSSRQLAVGPTSAISLMIAGTVGAMAEGDVQRYAQIASLAAFTVALLSLFAWLLRLSVLVKLISDSILVGFKAGAGLTISMTQLPSLLGVKGGGHNFFERAFTSRRAAEPDAVPRSCRRGHCDPAASYSANGCCPGSRLLLALSRCRLPPRRCWGCRRLGVPMTGEIPAGLPTLAGPALRLSDVEGNCSVGRRLPAAGLYRRCVRCAHFRCQARIHARSRGRSFLALVRPISRPRWDTATRWPADCRNRP